jgi:hypothetical protein
MARVPLADVQPFPVPIMSGGTVTTDDGNVQAEFAVNLKLRQLPTNQKAGTPTSHGGLTQWVPSTVGGESDRGGIVFKGKMYRVQGAGVYSFDTNGVRTLIGTVVNDGQRARLDYGFDFLIVVSAGRMYYYAPGGFSYISAIASTASGGSGYVVGDTITLSNTYEKLTVNTVSGGAVTSVNITTSVNMLTAFIPPNPVAQSLSSGGGTGASFNLTWAPRGNFIEVDTTLSAGITPILDACFMAGYVMVMDGIDVWCSSLTNLTFFPGYFGSAEYDPDGITAIYKFNNQLYVFGANTTQTMANTGGNNFPFTVQQSYTFDIGCVSRQTMCYFNRSLAWIGGGRNMPNGVWMLNGNAPAKISSAAVDYELSKLTADQVSVVTLEAISFEDSELLYVHLPDKTLLFDATATVSEGLKFWTQLNSGPNPTDFYRARNFVRFNGMWLCGDISDNRIGFLDSSTGGHYGRPVLHRSTGPMALLPLSSAGLRSVELKCVTGQSGDTSRISMQYSSDGIRWSQIRYASAAPRAAYDRRIRWIPGGLARDKMQIRLAHVTTQNVTWFQAMVELEALAT